MCSTKINISFYKRSVTVIKFFQWIWKITYLLTELPQHQTQETLLAAPQPYPGNWLQILYPGLLCGCIHASHLPPLLHYTLFQQVSLSCHRCSLELPMILMMERLPLPRRTWGERWGQSEASTPLKLRRALMGQVYCPLSVRRWRVSISNAAADADGILLIDGRPWHADCVIVGRRRDNIVIFPRDGCFC